MDDNLKTLTWRLGLTMEEASVALEIFRNPLPARARLRSGLVVRLLPGAVPDRAARDMIKRGWLHPEPGGRGGREEAEQPQELRAGR